MQRGIIGVTSSESDQFTTVEPYHNTANEFGMELEAAISPQQQRTLTGDVEFIEGRVLKETAEDDSKWVYDDGTIRNKSIKTRVQETSEFVAVPATDDRGGFAMVTSSDGVFAFPLLGRADHSPMDRARIELGDFYLEHESEFAVQTAGGSSDHADTIMAWGHDLDEDDQIGRSVETATQSNTLPQLAGEYVSTTLERHVRVNMAASGYVEVWEPDLSTYQFLRWVRAEVLPHVRGVVADEDEDKSEKAEADPDQSSLGDHGSGCDRCDREDNVQEYADGEYCAVCISAFEDDEADADPGGESA